jgi:hypothetical protein
MSPKSKKKKDAYETKEKTRLLEPEEWHDPPERRVISEFHKESTSESKNSHAQTSTEPLSEHVDQTCDTPKIIDLPSIEIMTYTLSRALFRRGLRVPLKFEGVVDMDISMKNADVILNTNEVSFEPPPLKIWRIIFSYKGKPVFEYGRGVKSNLKIHYPHALVFLISMWLGGRKLRKARKQAVLDACQDLAQNPPKKIEKMQKKETTDNG